MFSKVWKKPVMYKKIVQKAPNHLNKMNRKAICIIVIFLIISTCLISLLLIEKRYFTLQGRMNHAAMTYLTQYGYRDEDMSIEKSLKMFQKFSGIPESGVMDNETTEKMKIPRCGNKEDTNIFTNSLLRSNEDSMVAVWDKTVLTYSIQNLPKSGLEFSITESTIRRAFDIWENVSSLQFISVHPPPPNAENEVDILIYFVGNEEHQKFGDNTSFASTEAGKPIAHAFYPQGHPIVHHLEGDIHFDDDRGWTVNTEDGINLLQTCVHEIGHAIGLRHSSIQDSVMYFASKEKYDPDFHLHEDDIRGIQSLYGPPKPPVSDNIVDDTAADTVINPDELVDESKKINFADSSDYPESAVDITPERLSGPSTDYQTYPESPASFFPASPISKNILPYLNHCNYLYHINNHKKANACYRILTRHFPGLFSNS